MALAEKLAFSKEEIQLMHAGRKPETLSETEVAVWELADALARGRGPLAQELWEGAVIMLGRDCAASVVFTVGFYQYVSTILNGFDAQLPREEV
jgi:4-carboxymuconolactone decarboxylase